MTDTSGDVEVATTTPEESTQTPNTSEQQDVNQPTTSEPVKENDVIPDVNQPTTSEPVKENDAIPDVNQPTTSEPAKENDVIPPPIDAPQQVEDSHPVSKEPENDIAPPADPPKQLDDNQPTTTEPAKDCGDDIPPPVDGQQPEPTPQSIEEPKDDASVDDATTTDEAITPSDNVALSLAPSDAAPSDAAGQSPAKKHKHKHKHKGDKEEHKHKGDKEEHKHKGDKEERHKKRRDTVAGDKITLSPGSLDTPADKEGRRHKRRGSASGNNDNTNTVPVDKITLSPGSANSRVVLVSKSASASPADSPVVVTLSSSDGSAPDASPHLQQTVESRALEPSGTRRRVLSACSPSVSYKRALSQLSSPLKSPYDSVSGLCSHSESARRKNSIDLGSSGRRMSFLKGTELAAKNAAALLNRPSAVISALSELSMYSESLDDSEISCASKASYDDDIMSKQAFCAALDQQRALLYALECLHFYFRKPLLQTFPDGSVYSDVETLFKGLDEFMSVLRFSVGSLEEQCKKGPDMLLSRFILGVENFISSYRAFIKNIYGAIALLKESDEESLLMKSIRTCHIPEHPQINIFEFYWFVASYGPSMKLIVKSQQEYRMAYERIHDAIQASADYSQRFLSSCPNPSSCSSCGVLPTGEEFQPILDAANEASELESQVAGVCYFQQINTPPGSLLKFNPDRSIAEVINCTIVPEYAFGLAVNLSAVMLFFADGLAICTHNRAVNSRFKFNLLEWYPSESLWYERDIGAQSVQIANRMKPDDSVPLPPGWEEKGSGKKKRFLYKPADIKQEQHPNSEGRFIQKQKIKIDSTYSFMQCLKQLNRLTNGAIMTEDKSVPYLMFGVPLDALMQYESSFHANATIPVLVDRIIHHIISFGIGEKGIFRCAAEKRFLDDLISRIGKEKLDSVKLSDYSIHNVSGLLKHFLREMPEPLIPFDKYDAFLAVGLMPKDSDGQINRLSKLIGELPTNNRNLLYQLMRFLHQISCNEKVNAMNATNLAIVTAPNILRTKKEVAGSALMVESNKANAVVSTMISKYYDVFEASELGSVLRSSKMFEWVTFRRKLLGHNKSIRAFACLPERHTLISVDQTPSMILWDSEKGTFMREIVFSDNAEIRRPFDIVVANEGKTLWVSDSQWLFLFDSSSFELVKKLPYPEIFVMLVVGDVIWCGLDGKIIALDAKSYELIAEIKDVGAMISTMTLVGDGSVWAAGFAKRNNKGEIYVLNTRTRSLERTITSEIRRVNCMVTVSAGHNPYVWIGCDEGVDVWDGIQQTHTTRLQASKEPVQSMCVLGDQVWAGSKDRNIYIWTPDSHRCVGVLTGCHTDYVLCMTSFRRPGSQVYDVWTGSADRAICVWSASKVNENVQ